MFPTLIKIIFKCSVFMLHVYICITTVSDKLNCVWRNSAVATPTINGLQTNNKVIIVIFCFKSFIFFTNWDLNLYNLLYILKIKKMFYGNYVCNSKI